MAENQAVRALIWDMGGVLVRNMDPQVRGRLAEPYGMSSMELENLFFGNEVSARASVGLAHEGDIWDFVQKKLALKTEDMPQFIRDYWSCDQFDEELYAYTMSLRPRYKVALLSNAFFETRTSLKQRFPHFFDMFDVTVFSAEVGLVKPDPRIYQLVLQELKLQPQETVFVDDFIENVVGARAVGMHAVHFKSAAQALAALQEYFR